MSRRLLIAAVVAGFLTGIIALSGHSFAVLLHTVGGLVALVLVAVVASRVWDQPSLLILGAMIVATLTGFAWSWFGSVGVVVMAHLFAGVIAAAGAIILATDR